MDESETVHRMRAIVHSIWFMVARSRQPGIVLGDYLVGFYIRDRATGHDLYRQELPIRAGLDRATGRPVFGLEAFEDPPDEGEEPG